jgi:uncharacterized protein
VRKATKTFLVYRRNSRKAIDVVDIFRKHEEVPMIVEQAIQIKTKFGRSFVVWMQLGIVNEVATEEARKAGLIVVMDKCLMVEHHRLK